MYEILVVTLVSDTSFSDLQQNMVIGYNREHEKEGLPQQVHIMQRTDMLQSALAARNSALRKVTPLELVATFNNPILKKHNQRAYDFFKTFKAEDFAAEFKNVFATVAALEKTTVAALDKVTEEITEPVK